MKTLALIAFALVAASLFAGNAEAKSWNYWVSGYAFAVTDTSVTISNPSFTPSLGDGRIGSISPSMPLVLTQIAKAKLAWGDSLLVFKMQSPEWVVVGLQTFIYGHVVATAGQDARGANIYLVRLKNVPGPVIELHTQINVEKTEKEFSLVAYLYMRGDRCVAIDPPPVSIDPSPANLPFIGDR